MTKYSLYVHLEAKPGKEQEVADFLVSALPLVNQEPETTAWFALKMGPSTFGIFDFIRVPSPAARTMTATGRGALTRLVSSGIARTYPGYRRARPGYSIFGERRCSDECVYPPLTCRIPSGCHDGTPGLGSDQDTLCSQKA